MVFFRDMKLFLSLMLLWVLVGINAQQSVKTLRVLEQQPVKTIRDGAQQAVRTVKGVLKNPLKVKRPGKPLDSRFFGSKYGSLYKPEDFMDNNGTSINTTETALKSTAEVQDFSSTPGIDSVKSLKGRKLPPQNYLPIKQPKSNKFVEGVPLSAVNLDDTTETTTLESITTELTTITEGNEGTEGIGIEGIEDVTTTMSPTEKDDVM